MVKALDLRSNGQKSSWVRTPLLVDAGSFNVKLELCLTSDRPTFIEFEMFFMLSSDRRSAEFVSTGIGLQ